MTLELLRTPVEPEWIDYNGHLNVAYYHLLFDRATDKFLDELGLGEASARKGLGSMFALEDHITYQRELKVGDVARVTLQLLDFDIKRVHYFMRMFEADEGYLSATCEHLSSYVDFQTRRSAPMPSGTRDKLAKLHELHRNLPRPEHASQVIRIRRG